MPGQLNGKVVCFTGTLSMPRKQATEMAQRSGAVVVSSVTSAVNVVVVGASAGATKLGAAAAKGVEQWTEQEFFRRMTVEDTTERMGQNSARTVSGKASFLIALAWDALVDLDLHLICPDGKEIYYMDRTHHNCELDVDRMPSASGKGWKVRPIENLICEKVVLPGTYTVKVHYCCNDFNIEGPIPFTVHVKLGDSIEEVVQGTVDKVVVNDSKRATTVCTFKADSAGNFTVLYMGSTQPPSSNGGDVPPETTKCDTTSERAKKAPSTAAAGKKKKNAAAKKPASKKAPRP